MSDIKDPDYMLVLHEGGGVVIQARISRKSALIKKSKAFGNHYIIGVFRVDGNGDIVMKVEGGKLVEDQLTVAEIEAINPKLIEIFDVVVGRFARTLIKRSRWIVNGEELARRPYLHVHILEITATVEELEAAGLEWTQVVDPDHFLVEKKAVKESSPAASVTPAENPS